MTSEIGPDILLTNYAESYKYLTKLPRLITGYPRFGSYCYYYCCAP